MKHVSMTPIEVGCGNVFADLDLPDAADLETKAELTRQLYQRIKSLGLSQLKAAELLGLKQPDVSKLMNGRFAGFSVERLLELLNALAVDVDIVLRARGSRTSAAAPLGSWRAEPSNGKRFLRSQSGEPSRRLEQHQRMPHGRDIMDAEDVGAVPRGGQCRADRAERAVHRRVAQHAADERLPRKTKQKGAAQFAKPRQVAQYCQVVIGSLAEADPRVQRDPLRRDAGSDHVVASHG